MRTLIVFIAILLSAAICSSCRSSRQSSLRSVSSDSVNVTETRAVSATGDLLSLLSASRDLDLSDILIEFYPPDSLHPEARAAPRSLSVRNAKSREAAGLAIHGQSSLDGQGDMSIYARSSDSMQQSSSSDDSALHIPTWATVAYMAAALILLSLAMVRELRR